jgi:four helix bundle protein
MHNYKELIVWQKARFLVKQVYLLTQTFPELERFGLTIQLRRAAISISSNIAEGAGRTTTTDFMKFLDIANGSSFEVETQLLLSFDLGYINEDTLNQTIPMVQDVQKLLFNFRKSLNRES